MKENLKGKKLAIEVLAKEGTGLLNTRGSVTIPSDLRKKLNIFPGDAVGYVHVKVGEGDYADLQGIFIYPVDVNPRN